MSYADIYQNGEYLQTNPTWHVEESPFKAKDIISLLERNHVSPRLIFEVGCGAGEVLKQLQDRMGDHCEFWGYEISPQPYNLSRSRETERLDFELADLTKEDGVHADLLLILDVVEHLEDYFAFLRAIRGRSNYKVFHFPLDLSAQAVIRKNGVMKRRVDHAHIHYFTKEIALQGLIDTGYQIIDHFYAARSNKIGPRLIQKVFRVPRSVLFAVNQDFAVRVLGGYSLFVLAK